MRDSGSAAFDRRTALITLVASAAVPSSLWIGAQAISSVGKSKVEALPTGIIDDDGDAVTSPSLEVRLAEITEQAQLQAGLVPPGSVEYAEITDIVTRLEERGGSQIYASFAPGRWTMPWVGGWERIWAQRPDSSALGGAPTPSFRIATDAAGRPSMRPGSTLFSATSARMFVYGPGPGGITVEFLHSMGVGQKLLLSRAGTASNLGSNYFTLDFSEPLRAFAVERGTSGKAMGSDVLSTGAPVEGGEAVLGPTDSTLHTTYLSERLWVMRDAADGLVVFTRTETQSVMDRRGLVADGQLRPSAVEEEVRYGKLLFGENLSDYANWDKKVEKEAQPKRINDLLK